jgi:exopolysaccharide biosynthesis protein
MLRTPPRRILTLILVVVASLAGCTTELAKPNSSAVPPITAAGKPVGSGDGSETADRGWQQVDSAMELRKIRLATNGHAGHLTVVRLDPAAYQIRVKYDVANAGSIREWFDAIKPVAIINGGYFDQNRKATALVIFDGIRTGESYEGFGGMIAINAQGQFELRSLRQQPFDPNEELQQAMQSAPMLIQPGGVVSDLQPDDDRSRRTVIARDIQGRILLIVSDAAIFTLPELGQALKQSDLEIDAALNLDGGRSTGMYVRTETADVRVESFDKLPLVLTVQRL